MKRIFDFLYTDNRENGPKLFILNDHNELSYESLSDSSSIDLDDTHFKGICFEIIQNKFSVQHSCLGIGANNVEVLKIFDNLEVAFLYSKQQYTLSTRVPPFIYTGEDKNYYAIGSRLKIDIPDDMKCDIDYDLDDAYEFIIIISQNYFKSYSLNPFSIW